MLEPWWAIPARRAGLAAGAAVGADDGLAAAGEVNAVDDRDVAAGAAVDHVAPPVHAEDAVVTRTGRDVVAAWAGIDAVLA
jgi:hypothetical protein